MAFSELVTIVVDDYDPAIDFFTGMLGFELVEDSPSLTNHGRPKRWVVVRLQGSETGVLLARADGENQAKASGIKSPGGWDSLSESTTSHRTTIEWSPLAAAVDRSEPGPGQ